MNCLIYPFAENNASLVTAINQTRDDIQVTEIVVPNGCAPALREKGFEFSTNFIEALENVGGIIICDCRERDWMIKDIISKIKTALSCGKTVYNCTGFKPEELDEIKNASGFSEERFINYAVYSDFDNYNLKTYNDIDCPLIAIGNMLRGLDDCTGLFELTRRFDEKGFRAVPIGTTFDCKLVGGYVFPFNIFDLNDSEDNKISLLNTYFNDLQLMSGAELIIISIPDGFMKFSKELNEGFGVRTLMVTSALSADFFVFNVPNNQISAEMVPNLVNHIEQKYNLSIDVIAIDSRYAHYSDSLENLSVTYYPSFDSDVDKEVAVFNEIQSQVPAIRLNNKENYDNIVSMCMAKLS